jgi:hypothetical protein
MLANDYMKNLRAYYDNASPPVALSLNMMKGLAPTSCRTFRGWGTITTWNSWCGPTWI